MNILYKIIWGGLILINFLGCYSSRSINNGAHQEDNIVYLDTSFNLINNGSIICNLNKYAPYLKWNKGILNKGKNNGISFCTEKNDSNSNLIVSPVREIYSINKGKILFERKEYLSYNGSSYLYNIKEIGELKDSVLEINNLSVTSLNTKVEGFYINGIDDYSFTWNAYKMWIENGSLIGNTSSNNLDTLFLANSDSYVRESFSTTSYLVIVYGGKYSKVNLFGKNKIITLPLEGKHVQMTKNENNIYLLFPTFKMIKEKYQVFSLLLFDLNTGSLILKGECLDALLLEEGIQPRE